jgi:hypothetical protein
VIEYVGLEIEDHILSGSVPHVQIESPAGEFAGCDAMPVLIGVIFSDQIFIVADSVWMCIIARE